MENAKQQSSNNDSKTGGNAEFNCVCRTEKCVYNVSRTCKNREIKGKFCISKTIK